VCRVDVVNDQIDEPPYRSTTTMAAAKRAEACPAAKEDASRQRQTTSPSHRLEGLRVSHVRAAAEQEGIDVLHQGAEAGADVVVPIR
jgi:hypothetical protein